MGEKKWKEAEHMSNLVLEGGLTVIISDCIPA